MEIEKISELFLEKRKILGTLKLPETKHAKIQMELEELLWIFPHLIQQ